VRRLADDTGRRGAQGADDDRCRPAGPIYFVVDGDARLATAGTGDVLAGIIGALLAMGVPRREPLAGGAWIHARAGAKMAPLGLVAGDLDRGDSPCPQQPGSMIKTRNVVLGLGAFAILATAGAAYAAGTINGAADMPSRVAVRVDPPMPAVVIGDSAISALRWVPGADNAVIGFEHTLDLESCRRLYSPSCRGREGRTPRPCSRRCRARAQVQDPRRRHGLQRGQLDDGDVVPEHRPARRDLGTSRSCGGRCVRRRLRRAGVGSPITSRSRRATRSCATCSPPGAYPDVVLADWNAYTAHKQDWFVTDGVHYRQIGAWARRTT
jgi:hypothetical protein